MINPLQTSPRTPPITLLRPCSVRRGRFRDQVLLFVALFLLPALPLHAADIITPAQATTLATNIEKSFANRDPAAFNAVFDDQAVVKRALAGYPLKDSQAKEMAAGIKVGADLSNRIVKTIQEGGSYKLLRVEPSTASAAPIPVFRLLSRESINYHRLILARNAAGEITIADVEIFISGEPLSQTMRRLLLPALAEADKGKADDVVKPLQDVAAMQRVAAGGDYKTALELWDKLTPALRQERALMLTRLQYAARIGPAKYDAAVKEYEKLFPSDPVLDLTRIYSLSAAKKFDQVLAAIDRLDRVVQDPYLDLLRAQAHASLKSIPKAQEFFTKVLKWDASFERAWGGLLVIALTQKDFPQTTKLLTDREKATGKPLTPEFLEKAKEFGEFVKSPEYTKWKQARGGK